MFKISISGKANTGKNTLSGLLVDELANIGDRAADKGNGLFEQWGGDEEIIAFADPIKEIIKTMFPNVPRKHLYGASKYRALPIPGAYKDGKPLTVRQCLIDLGTAGRMYNDMCWINAFNTRLEKAENSGIDILIVTDTRFRNEFDHLKNLGFYHIRTLRESDVKINHISDTGQDSIKDHEFDYVLNNNSTLNALKKEVIEKIAPAIPYL